MLVDFAASVTAMPLEVEDAAVRAERDGYDGFGAPETRHDVFPALTLAARATETITLQAGIAVAFARNPMSLAMLANDLQLISGGRFQLGLGSQVQAHIERRFAMPWGRPAARMADFIAAVRAIWAAWHTGGRLAYRGEFYRHTLMSDFFNPGPNAFGNPPILLAAVGERMTEVAGRHADGLLVHPLTSASYLHERTVPMVRAARGGSLDDFTLSLSAFVVLGADEKARAEAERAVRGQIAFYASTPAYRGVFDLHGWGALADQLRSLSVRQAWDEMAGLITDEVLDTFAVGGDVAANLRSRFGGTIDRISLYTPYSVDPALVTAVRADLIAG
ncbi:TIGR03617 family F420-dependent LLM class oxidoreductase [Paractinoplanes rishiriensis]|uniref:LLM class F420-dependent oxidoreductase n=1 Tax=Paractinoplanes rishiriensis TaxID=1050105 RepID=A0A919K4Y7_9ACTN|nr:TIGR03617 family F420-dependent LLM class oxidoreductase [Actinoplanes rishiriensis]GIE98922.1 LLM class F420-dependent oxidoreductase [Actinoplanes rishiriensis]